MFPLIACLLLLQQPGSPSRLPKVQNNNVIFNNGNSFTLPLYKSKLIDQLTVNNKKYLILSGFGCEDCCANREIFIHSFDEGPFNDDSSVTPFPYPGSERDYETNRIIYKARTFYGNVLPNIPNGVIWYQQSQLENGKFEKSVILVTIDSTSISPKLIKTKLPNIELTLKLLKNGKCKEIKGLNYHNWP